MLYSYVFLVIVIIFLYQLFSDYYKFKENKIVKTLISKTIFGQIVWKKDVDNDEKICYYVAIGKNMVFVSRVESLNIFLNYDYYVYYNNEKFETRKAKKLIKLIMAKSKYKSNYDKALDECFDVLINCDDLKKTKIKYVPYEIRERVIESLKSSGITLSKETLDKFEDSFNEIDEKI